MDDHQRVYRVRNEIRKQTSKRKKLLCINDFILRLMILIFSTSKAEIEKDPELEPVLRNVKEYIEEIRKNKFFVILKKYVRKKLKKK